MTESEHNGNNRIAALAFYGLLWAAIILYLSQPVVDGSVWGHLRYGLDFLQAGRVLPTDIYSYMSKGCTWIDSTWLSEVIFALIYRYLNLHGLVTIHLLISAIIFVLLFEMACNRIPALVSLALIFMSALLLSQQALAQIGTVAFGCLLWMAELYILKESSGLWRLLLLPIVFMLWTNLDPSFVAGLVLLYAWTLAEIVQRKIARAASGTVTTAMITALLSTGACLITPYGSALLLTTLNNLLFFQLSPQYETPMDHPLHLASPLGIVYSGLCASAIWIIRERMAKTQPVRSFALVACLLLPMAKLYYLPLSTIAVIVLCSTILAERLQQQKNIVDLFKLHKLSIKIKPRLALIASFLAVLLLAMAVCRTATIVESTDMPEAAVKLLQESGIKGNIACLGEWSEYCIWHLYPHMKVSIDRRAREAYSDTALLINLFFWLSLKKWDVLLAKEGTDIVLTSINAPSFDLMKLVPGWKLVYSDKKAAIFVPISSPLIDKLKYFSSAKQVQLHNQNLSGQIRH